MTMTKSPVTSLNGRVTEGTKSRKQTFLVGDEVYLRTFRVGDHKNATSWRKSVFPKATSLMRRWIEKDLPKAAENDTGYMAIVRKRDDVIIGSAKLNHEDVCCELEMHVDPLYGDAGLRWKAEATCLLAGWLTDERSRPAVFLTLPSSEQAVIDIVTAFGFRESARLRQMHQQGGQRFDRVWLEYLSKAWIERVGDPKDTPLERSGTGEPRPVPPKVTLDGDPPKSAFLVGERVYLRPEEKDDQKLVAEWARKETEAFWDIGRHMPSSVRLAAWTDSHQEPDKPEWIWFSVCLRETDELIGAVGLIDVDYVNLIAETGSFFHRPDYRGNGYGSEAKHLLLEYAFEFLGLHMVQSWVVFPNTRSAAALRKQGYREAGQVNWVYPFEGGFGNFVVFDLLADEWRTMPRQAWDAN